MLPSGASRRSSMPVCRLRCANYVPKLMQNSYEKISFIRILGDKIFIAIAFKHCKKFNLRYLCFSKKAIETAFMLWFNQFYRPILNWVFCAFFPLLLILMFPKHSSMFERLSEFIIKLIPRGLFLVTQTLRPPKSFFTSRKTVYPN